MTSPFLPENKGENSHKEDALPAPEGKEHSYHLRQGAEAEKNLYKQTLFKNSHLPLCIVDTCP